MAVTTYNTVQGRIISQHAGGVETSFLTDALGSVTATVDQNAAVVNQYRYKPYGERLSKTGAGADPRFQWVGESGYCLTGTRNSSYYVRARHYSSVGGRWASIDPLWPVEAAYVYCLDSPSSVADASGMGRCNLEDACWQTVHDPCDASWVYICNRICRRKKNSPPLWECWRGEPYTRLVPPCTFLIIFPICCLCRSGCDQVLPGDPPGSQERLAKDGAKKGGYTLCKNSLKVDPVTDVCNAGCGGSGTHYQWKCCRSGNPTGKVISVVCCDCYENGLATEHCYLTHGGCH